MLILLSCIMKHVPNPVLCSLLKPWGLRNGPVLEMLTLTAALGELEVLECTRISPVSC